MKTNDIQSSNDIVRKTTKYRRTAFKEDIFNLENVANRRQQAYKRLIRENTPDNQK